MPTQEEKNLHSKQRLFIKYLNLPIESDPSLIGLFIVDDIQNFLIQKLEEITGVVHEPSWKDDNGIDWDLAGQFGLPSFLSEIIAVFNEYAVLDEAEAMHLKIEHEYTDNPIALFIEKAGYQTVFGYLDNGCEECDQNIFTEMRTALSNDPNKISKCYECDYLSVKAMVLSLIKNKQSEVKVYLNRLRELINEFPPVNYLNNDLKYVTFFNPTQRLEIYRRLDVEIENWLSKLLLSFIAFDIFDYKIKRKGFRNLKCCPLCGEFFDSLDKKAVYCYSRSCQKSIRALKKQSQRKKNPSKYI